MLVVSDVEDQGQLWRIQLAGRQGCDEHAVVGARLLQAMQAGRLGQAKVGRAVQPALTRPGDAQGEVGLVIEFGTQLRGALGEVFP